jgi:UPF0755 protein
VTELGFRTSHRVRPRRWRGCLAVFVAVSVLVVAVGLAAVKGQSFLADFFTVPDFSGPGQGEVVVQVAKGDTSRDIAATLEREGVVKSAEAFTRAARRDSRALGIQPGYYKLRQQMAGSGALALILDPTSRVLDRVTVPEGRRLSQVLTVLQKKTGIPRKEFTAALRDREALGLPSYAKGRVEGLLFPATYDIDPGTSALSLLQEMTGRYAEVTDGLRLSSRAKARGLTPMEIVTVASLIEAEARRPQDFPKIARVIYNRLDAGMILQLDSTVHYAVNDYSRASTTPEQREVDSKYNTYRYEGLPPGPINAPGERAIDAALSPASGPWLFFVTVDLESGETKFAETVAGHDQYVAEYRQWCDSHRGRC